MRPLALCSRGLLALALPLLLLAAAAPARAQADCAAPAAVCDARGAVFRIEAFDPFASAVRVGPDLLVTNRHVIADVRPVTVVLDDGATLTAEPLPSAYAGDLALLRVAGLPDGPTLAPEAAGETTGDLYTLGADLTRRSVRAYPSGRLLLAPAEGHPLARLHHTAYIQPGNSGGALVDGDGELVGIATSGGEGRFEAIPAAQVRALIAGQGPDAEADSAERGAAYRVCGLLLDELERRRGPLAAEEAKALATACRRTNNRQDMDSAAVVLGRAGELADSRALLEAALAQDPNALNTRLSLVITLQLAGLYAEEVPHVRRLIEVLPDDPQVLRFAIQTGRWGGDPALAERGYQLLLQADPQQAQAARRFLDADIPPPPRRQ